MLVRLGTSRRRASTSCAGCSRRAEVSALRDTLSRRMDALGSPRFLPPAQAYAVEEIATLSCHPCVSEALAEILGPDFVLLGDLCVQRNMYGVWHADSDPDGHRRYLVDPEFRVVKCGVFLQDNDAEGGGLSLVPGGHRFPLRRGGLDARFAVKALANRWARRRAVRLALRAGDALIFDFRLPHVSSRPSHGGPARRDKLVIYFNAARSESAASYLEHVERRAVAEELPAGEVYWSDTLRRVWPADYPAALVRAAERAGTRVAALPADEARRWQFWYERISDGDGRLAARAQGQTKLR